MQRYARIHIRCDLDLIIARRLLCLGSGQSQAMLATGQKL
jgi:hypothetical protein